VLPRGAKKVMPFAIENAWPPALPQRGYGHRGSHPPTFPWPPGGHINWPGGSVAPKAASVAEPEPIAKAGGCSAEGAAAAAAYEAHEAQGGLSADAARAVLARAKACMAVPQTLEEFTTMHGIEAALNAALNEVAKARPAAPMSAMAQLLPAPAHPTPTLPAAANDEIAALRRAWIALHGIEEGVSIY
jgi:hypothetical protein